jgi:hypothetical protein
MSPSGSGRQTWRRQIGQPLLTAGLAQQIRGIEQRRCWVVFAAEQQQRLIAHRCHARLVRELTGVVGVDGSRTSAGLRRAPMRP